MKFNGYLLILFSVIYISCQPNASQNEAEPTVFKKITVLYPEAYRDSTQSDNFHGLQVSDPYQWLEDENSPSTEFWVKSQQSITNKYLEQIPYREAIKNRLESIWNYERTSVPNKKGNYYYIFKNNGLQNQDVLYRMSSLSGNMEEVLNPNTFSTDGTASLGEYSFSKDGSLLAYQISEGGSDWRTIRIKDLESGKILDDKIDWVKFSAISWYQDGFFYSRYPAPEEGNELSGENKFHQVYYHKVGTAQSEDELIFADRVHPQRNIYTTTTGDERFLILSISESTSGNALYFQDLRSGDPSFIPVVEDFNNDFEVIDNIGRQLLVKTNYKAPNQRIVQISTSRPEEAYWEEIIPESEDVLQEAKLLGGKIVAHYIHNASSKAVIYSTNGKQEKEIALPEIGTITQLNGQKNEDEAFFGFTSFTSPETSYSLDMVDLSIAVYKNPKIDFASAEYETKQIWYESYDGQKIPMFVIHKKGLTLDGSNPTLLYGYGGFNISVLPQFNRTRINLFPIVLENGGVCAVANIRGGGEFGKDWHKAGTKDQKQNVFDDFQAAAEYLIANKYTSSDKLAIYGRSNGGLLVGACMTQRPDLYRVAIPAVGVMDMLRYHKFTIGWAWATDYGRSDNPKDFDYLFSYSPLHNIAADKYPATFITTADHDDRVVPAHSYKFTSELQFKQQSKSPVLIRIDASAGHGAGKPISMKIEEAADVLSFMFYNMEEDIKYEVNR